jgi:hypothetical protein
MPIALSKQFKKHALLAAAMFNLGNSSGKIGHHRYSKANKKARHKAGRFYV